MSANALRKAELAVLAAGAVIALAAVLYAGRNALDANTAWTEGGQKALAIALTLGSQAIVAAIAVSPYLVLYLLGRLLPPQARAARIAGLVVCCAAVAASALLYAEAASAVHGPGAKSTTATLFALFPAFVMVCSTALYALIIGASRLTARSRR